MNYTSRFQTVTKLRFGCLSLRNPTQRDKWWVKGKIALLRKPEILQRKDLCPQKNKLPIADKRPEFSKEGFRDAQASGTTCRIAQSP